MLRANSTAFVSFIDIELPWSKTATNSQCSTLCAVFDLGGIGMMEWGEAGKRGRQTVQWAVGAQTLQLRQKDLIPNNSVAFRGAGC